MLFYAFAKAYAIFLNYIIFFRYPIRDCVSSGIMKRNQEKGITFRFEASETYFDFMKTWFEKSTPKEVKDANEQFYINC